MTANHFNPRAYVRHDARTVHHLPGCPFQSTCLREARQTEDVSGAIYTGFQSTCLREARPYQTALVTPLVYFNPRAYVRHDNLGHSLFLPSIISIHVPT